MKRKLSREPHLVLQNLVIQPGEEWEPRSPDWLLIQVRSGTAYWLDENLNRELATGTVVLRSDGVRGIVRASQLENVSIHFFRVVPNLMTGLITLGEQLFFESAAAKEEFSFQILQPDSPVAVKLRDLYARRNGNHFSFRLDLLQLFIQAFYRELENCRAVSSETAEAKERLLKLLKQTAASDLLNLSFAELVHKMDCTPRHLSRVFHEVVGMSFREKQTSVRLARACELLTTTEFKVVDVALESGYQSLSSFNIVFRKQFGMSPSKWRQKHQIHRLPRIPLPDKQFSVIPMVATGQIGERALCP